MNCKKCGAPLSGNEKFCAGCGAEVVAETPVQPTGAAPVAEPTVAAPVVNNEPTVAVQPTAEPTVATQAPAEAAPVVNNEPTVAVQPTVEPTVATQAPTEVSPVVNNEPTVAVQPTQPVAPVVSTTPTPEPITTNATQAPVAANAAVTPTVQGSPVTNAVPEQAKSKNNNLVLYIVLGIVAVVTVVCLIIAVPKMFGDGGKTGDNTKEKGSTGRNNGSNNNSNNNGGNTVSNTSNELFLIENTYEAPAGWTVQEGDEYYYLTKGNIEVILTAVYKTSINYPNINTYLQQEMETSLMYTKNISGTTYYLTDASKTGQDDDTVVYFAADTPYDSVAWFGVTNDLTGSILTEINNMLKNPKEETYNREAVLINEDIANKVLNNGLK